MNRKGKLIFMSEEAKKKYSKEQIREIEHYFEEKMKRDSYLRVVYNPECGCKVDKHILLESRPMLPVILGVCPACNKYCQLERSDPIIFYDPITETNIPIDKLSDYVITESPQKRIIQAIQFSYIFKQLEKELDRHYTEKKKEHIYEHEEEK